jgi:hypothetical protein
MLPTAVISCLFLLLWEGLTRFKLWIATTFFHPPYQLQPRLRSLRLGNSVTWLPSKCHASRGDYIDYAANVFCPTCFAIPGESCRTKYVVHGNDEVTPVICLTHASRLFDLQGAYRPLCQNCSPTSTDTLRFVVISWTRRWRGWQPVRQM